MAESVRYVENPLWVEEVLAAPQARRALFRIGGTVRKQIIAHEPVRTGEYQANLGSRMRLSYGDTPGSIRVVTYDPLWHIINFGDEYGGVHNQPYRDIQNGVESAGLKFTWTYSP